VRGLLAAAAAAAAIAGCGGDEPASEPLSAADVERLGEIRERLLTYCGERKANGADETQPVPAGTQDEIDDLLALYDAHRDESFELDGDGTAMDAFMREQQETLDDCSEQQEERVADALGS
jgi:hypothetical protein